MLSLFFFSFIISYSNQGQDGNVDQITDYDQVLGDLADDDYNMLSNLSGYVVNWERKTENSPKKKNK